MAISLHIKRKNIIINVSDKESISTTKKLLYELYKKHEYKFKFEFKYPYENSEYIPLPWGYVDEFESLHHLAIAIENNSCEYETEFLIKIIKGYKTEVKSREFINKQ